MTLQHGATNPDEVAAGILEAADDEERHGQQHEGDGERKEWQRAKPVEVETTTCRARFRRG